MKHALLFAAALLAAPTVACDAADDAQAELQAQVQNSQVLLEDAMFTVDEDSSDDAVVVDAAFELGVDDGFYMVEVVVGEELIVYEVDARTRERVEAERRRARRDRVDLARRHRAHRRRLAELVREIREERGAAAIRARLAGDDAEVEVLDRRGDRSTIRRRLAAANDEQGGDDGRGRGGDEEEERGRDDDGGRGRD